MAVGNILSRIDRRLLFLSMAIAVIVPFVLKAKPSVQPMQWSRDLYDAVEAVKPGGVVLVSCDYDPGSEAELYPMTVAIFEHLARKDVRVVITELWPAAGPLVKSALEETFYKHGKKYGIDFVDLGYKTGGQILISKTVDSIAQAFPDDVNQTPVSEIPAMRGVRKAADIDFFVSISAGTPGTKEWVQQCQSRVGKPMGCGVTAVQAPDLFPYILNHQLIGILGGLRGAADYEALVGKPGRGITGMGPQTYGHLLIVLFIVLGNLGFLLSRDAPRAS